jgi:hypothetical protein
LLSALSVATLAACGSGGSDEPADKYVGKWLSKCYSYVAQNGNTYYTRQLVNMVKESAGVLQASSTAENAYADGACSNLLSTFSSPYNNHKINLGKETTFAGIKAEVISYTNLVTNLSYPGFAASDNNQFFIVTYDVGNFPSGWGRGAPYGKQ